MISTDIMFEGSDDEGTSIHIIFWGNLYGTVLKSYIS